MNEPEPLAMTINSLCAAVGISRRHFYELLRRGEGPPVVRLGTRVVIRREAAGKWLEQHEQST